VSSIHVYLENGSKRSFACAVDWPGWCRSGKTEEQALDALAAAGERYAVVAEEAGFPLPAAARSGPAAFEVGERLPGSGGTDFGVPEAKAAGDAAPLSRKDAERLTALISAAWKALDRAAASAPAELRKGPRGGGRDRDAIVAHVLGAEAAYARKLGLRLQEPDAADGPAVAAFRQAILEAFFAPPDPNAGDGKRWPLRYAARRIAWHALDHAWEIEDRSRPA
jgi:predicted RNase H-like HicB family nuclease